MRIEKVVKAVLAALTVTLAPAEAAAPPSAAAAPPRESAGRMSVPDGFKVTLFAAEPDVRQPIAFNTDDRGRLWVAENFSYPGWLQPAKEKDRILILEDRDGDGRFDRRTVFWDQGNTVSGLVPGFGGVFVAATPNLLFIPDHDGDDVPDGPAEVVLDGWDVKAQHNLFNALNWGPDGWLYGCNGIMSNSRVGRPGTPDAQRVPINCGVWRYHPTTKAFEAVAHGTTNPWGLDFDEFGQMFITNCVIPHLFHVVPGGRYQRMYGEDFNRHTYQPMSTCADHVHWDTTEAWSDIRSRGVTPTTDRAGGGHAHTGAMVYLGDNWPDRFRQTLFTCNIHGHRVNNDTLTRKGSGYVARHGKDFLTANDDWFRGMDLRYGPDGGVFLTDWSDVGECHENDADLAHRENGRIYKITYGDVKPVRVDLAKLDDLALAKLQAHKNDWYVRHARRILEERAAVRPIDPAAVTELARMFREETEAPRQLRALWALHAANGLNREALLAATRHGGEEVRAWGVRLLFEGGAISKTERDRLGVMSRDDPSPRVRLALASALQRLPLGDRVEVVEGLAAHGDDATDANLPLMLWYGAEPLVEYDPGRAVDLAGRARIPLLRRFLARRAVQTPHGGPLLVEKLGRTDDPAAVRDVLAGMTDALRGRKHAEVPTGWPGLFDRLAKSTDAGVRKEATRLALLYHDPHAADLLRAILADASAPPAERRDALESLAGQQVAGLAGTLHALLDDPGMRGPTLRALAAYNDPGTPAAILKRFPALSDDERDDAVNTLAARPASAGALLDAVAAGTVPRRDVSVTAARQLRALGDPAVAAKLEAAWGSIRPTSRDKVVLMARYREVLTAERLKTADLSRGRAVFKRACAGCHKMYGEGGDVGPELTGSDRANLAYVLENVLDPSASVGRDYKLNTIATADGRLISGILRSQDERTLVVQTVNERLTLDRGDVEALKPSDQSMMPEGLFETLSADEVRDLVAYLGAKTQVPSPDEPAKSR